MRHTYYTILSFLILLAILDITLCLLSLQISITINATTLERITAMSTTAAVLVALFGKEIRKFLIYPSMKIVNSKENLQYPEPDADINQHIQGHTRLFVQNVGLASAVQVQVYVTKITDQDRVRDDFLPVPLCWTHNGLERTFYPNQSGYLDLCRRDNVENQNCNPKLALIPGAGVFNYQNIWEGTSVLELTISEESGRIEKYNVTLNWQPDMQIAHITAITRTNN